jgi:hypothetical protein
MVPPMGGPVGRPSRDIGKAWLAYPKRLARLGNLSVQAHDSIAGVRAHHVSGKGRRDVTYQCEAGL